jgi:hypothetical protein
MNKLLLLLIIMPLRFFAQISAVQILNKCITVHDPDRQALTLKADFMMNIVRKNAADRVFTKDDFSYSVNTDTLVYKQEVKKGKFKAKINGKKPSESEIKKYNLDEERTIYLKEVYEYMMLLPMRLEKDIKYLKDQVEEEEFKGRQCYKLTIQYLPEQENETWHFYIDKSNFMLQGYQFYLMDSNTNGEYIYLENYTKIKKMLIPKTKLWYWNKDKSYFRTDLILNAK